MSKKDSNETTSSKVTSFLSKNKVFFLVSLLVLCLALIAFIVISKVTSSAKEKSLSKIDEISFALTDGSDSLSEDELLTRRTEALASLAPFNSKGGIVGARANLLSGEISYQLSQYEVAADFYKSAAERSKNNYLYSISMYNLAVMYEEQQMIDKASESYKAAYENKNCLFASHAGFSYARTLETLGKYQEAISVYESVNDKFSGESWANLSKTRIIAIKAEKKVE